MARAADLKKLEESHRELQKNSVERSAYDAKIRELKEEIIELQAYAVDKE